MLPRLAARRPSLIHYASKRYLARFSDRFDKHVPPKLLPLWHHPTGPKTIFFWAPVFKMSLTVAALGDLNRNPHDISIPQTISLLLNGIFCGRFSMVIEPKNYVYLTANVMLALTQTKQLINMLTRLASKRLRIKSRVEDIISKKYLHNFFDRFDLHKLATRSNVVSLISKRCAFADRFDKNIPPKFLPLWNHPTGPKTIFFWAPIFKMGLLLAAFGDLNRNKNDISIPQTISLLLNGTLSCRFAMVIHPRNYVYLLSNFLLAVVEINQLKRALSKSDD